MGRARRVVSSLAVLWMLAWSANASAQTRREIAVDVSAGWLGYLEVSEPFVGTAARVYLTPRVAVGPDIVYARGSQHTHLMMTGNLTLDFHPQFSDGEPAVPYLVLGIGAMHDRRRSLSFNEQSLSLGGGVRWVGKHVTGGFEGRVGTPLHLRFNLVAGVRF